MRSTTNRAAAMVALALALLGACREVPEAHRQSLFPYEQALAARVCGTNGPVQVIDGLARVVLDASSAPSGFEPIRLGSHPYTHHPIVIRRGALVLKGGAVVRCVVCRNGGQLIIEQGKFLLADGCVPHMAPTYAGWGPPPSWGSDLAVQLAAQGRKPVEVQ